MTDSFDKSQIELPSDTKSTGGLYDELLEAGMATRLVKGTLGKPERTPQAAAD